jgi:hypothetical protein
VGHPQYIVAGNGISEHINRHYSRDDPGAAVFRRAYANFAAKIDNGKIACDFNLAY